MVMTLQKRGSSITQCGSGGPHEGDLRDRKSTRLNSSHLVISYAVFCLKKKKIFAYAMVYTDMPWKPSFRVVGILPLLSPPFVVSSAYVMLFAPHAVITYIVI